MFKTSCVIGATMLFATTASAADLPSRRAPPVFVLAPPPVFSWTGAYLGLNAGYAFSDGQTIATVGNNGPGAAPVQAPFNTNTVGNVATGRRTPSIGSRQDGFTGGGQIGYNYQLAHNVVLGVEADAAYTGGLGTPAAVVARY